MFNSLWDITKQRGLDTFGECPAETQLSASEGKIADIGGINILKRGRLYHLFTLNGLHS